MKLGWDPDAVNTIQYSIVRMDGEWKLVVDHEIRGVFPNEEAAMGAALAAAEAARKLGRRAVVGAAHQQPVRRKLVVEI